MANQFAILVRTDLGLREDLQATGRKLTDGVETTFCWLLVGHRAVKNSPYGLAVDGNDAPLLLEQEISPLPGFLLISEQETDAGVCTAGCEQMSGKQLLDA